MKTLLLLNGPYGWQTGIEDGFIYLKKIGEIKELKLFYFEDYSIKFGTNKAIEEIKRISKEFLPQIIFISHISSFPINHGFMDTIKNLSSKPFIIYDEGDMYGSWAKPITSSMKCVIKNSNLVSIRGLGKFYKKISEFNKNIILTPNHADIARFDTGSNIPLETRNEITFIGNRVKSKLFNLRRLPGNREREVFLKALGATFPDYLKIYGNGWEGFAGYQGTLDFQQQMVINKYSLITVSYEHYPTIPYFFSNRLPIALFSGSIFVCNYHEGYENIFNNSDFIYFFKTNDEAIDIINYLLSLDIERVIEKKIKSRKFAISNFTPEVVWTNLFKVVKAKRKSQIEELKSY